MKVISLMLVGFCYYYNNYFSFLNKESVLKLLPIPFLSIFIQAETNIAKPSILDESFKVY